MKRLTAGLFALLPLAPTPAAAALPPPKVDKVAAVTGNTQFALELYGKLRAKEGNLFLSPFSISTALAMTSAGARGKTLEQMASTLHLPEQNRHPTLAAVLRQVNAGGKKGGYQLSTANALWGQKGHPFLPAFTRLTRDRYGAGLSQLDFKGDAEAARRAVNAWVAEQTKDKIKDLLAKGVVNRDTRLVLTNAVYFKGDWADPFKKDRTGEEDFRLADGKAVKAPLMHQTGHFAYHGEGALQVLELPYAGKEVSLVVLLPKEVDGLPALEKGLTPAKLAGWLKGLRRLDVDVTLPRFKVTAEFELKPALADLGMELAFSPGAADFSGIDGTKDLFLSAVIHKAFADVNEKGTEAAAAAGVVVEKSEAKDDPPRRVEFRADRPFLFLIRDRRSDSILFLGRLANPR